MLSSYPSIYAVGHRAVKDILTGSVCIQEKVDGSQISFGIDEATELLHIRSKGAEVHTMAPDGMFKQGVEAVLAVADKLTPGWTYRGEYLRVPKHNALAYERIPQNHIIIFDVERSLQDFLPYPEMQVEANRLDFETVPLLFDGEWNSDIGAFKGLLETNSILGGVKIEGVVIKNYALFGPDKKVLMAKYVSEAFKEAHAESWGVGAKKHSNIVDSIIAGLRTPSRWYKAVQHLREAGLLEDSPKDIGLLFREVPADLEKECSEMVKDALYDHFWPQIRRGATAGVAEWYKELLLKQQFEKPAEVLVEGSDGKLSE